jgi:glycine cleavage system H protein
MEASRGQDYIAHEATHKGDLKLKDYEIPDSLLYTKEHEWVQPIGNTYRIGISDYAAKTLNDIVYLTLPPVGHPVKQFESFGTVESIKAVSELYSPLSGSIARVNQDLQSHPELVNQSPYDAGWIVEIKASNLEAEKRNLLTARQYADHLGALEK